MSTDGQGIGGLPGRDASPGMAELRLRCERLQEIVQELEREKKRDAEALAAAQAELKEYQHLVYKWAHQHVREEDWRDFAEGDYTIPLEDVVAELERQAEQRWQPTAAFTRSCCWDRSETS